MKIGYWLVVAAIGAGSVAQADTVEPGHYQITLTDWDNNQLFNAIPNPTDVNTNDFQPEFCDGFLACDDPSVRINKGGGSTSEDGPFSFSSGPDAAGNTVVLNFSNSGAPITELLLTVNLNPDQAGELFTCDGGDVFQNCGFFNDGLEILFYNPFETDGIPTATTPEPSQWLVMLLGFAALIVVTRKRSASLSCAGTGR